MTLRTRIAVTAAVAVAVAFLIAAVGLYTATARTLRGEVDRSLRQLASELVAPGDAPRGPRGPRGVPSGARPGYLGGAGGFVQFVDSAGQVLNATGDDRLPHGEEVRAVAAGEADGFFQTVQVRGQPVRTVTVGVAPGIAAQIARPLDEVEASLAALRNRLALGALVAVALATGLGVLVARRAVEPVRRLTALAEEVAATGDLTRRIALDGGGRDRGGRDLGGGGGGGHDPGGRGGGRDRGGEGDELHRLARTFNGMLANLEQARLAQQQLVADASHELRTPLTSLRTNIEVLAIDAAATSGDGPGLSPADRRRLLDDLTVQLGECGRLVAALVELARGAQPAVATTPVQLDELVEHAVDRARVFAGDDQKITVSSEPVAVTGERDRLDRAVANLLDNAVKYGQGRPVAVEVLVREDSTGRRAAVVRVRDGGPGIAPEDLPRVFERFYRSPGARSATGSGLGLAIVKQVAEAHGGGVRAESAAGGGTVMILELPAEHDATV